MFCPSIRLGTLCNLTGKYYYRIDRSYPLMFCPSIRLENWIKGDEFAGTKSKFAHYKGEGETKKFKFLYSARIKPIVFILFLRIVKCAPTQFLMCVLQFFLRASISRCGILEFLFLRILKCNPPQFIMCIWIFSPSLYFTYEFLDFE